MNKRKNYLDNIRWITLCVVILYHVFYIFNSSGVISNIGVKGIKEFDAICELCKTDDTILALGGGAVMFDRNVEALKENGCKIVFIDTDFDVIKERLLNDETRPLLKLNDTKALYEKRLPIYNSVCDIKVSCKNEDSDTIAQMIFEEIKKV